MIFPVHQSQAKPLRSGWAWGQAYLQDGVAAFVAPVGAGKLFAFGPEITFRAQAQGTFKLLFNQLYMTGSGTQPTSVQIEEQNGANRVQFIGSVK